MQLRRIQGTGSLDGTIGGVFELDKRSTTKVNPSNLNAVISGSAVTASFQESNIYSKAWTSGRYDGAKLTSGSLFFNDPAISFKPFEATRFPLLASSSYIRSLYTGSLTLPETDTFYFNPPYKQIRSADTAGSGSLIHYHQGSINDLPPEGQPIFYLDKKDFKRVTKAKIYIPEESVLIRIDDNLAAFEPAPVPAYTASTTDNIFTIEFHTLANNGDNIYYWNQNDDAFGITIRPGETEVLLVSGTYIADLNEYSSQAPGDNNRILTPWTGQPWNSTLGVSKTYGTIISSSRNIP